jgi:DNA repair exonuclease SbcCD ATPase subunit
MSILEKLAERMKQRDLDASVRFAQLVQDIANDKKPAIELVEKILADAGKTLMDLEAGIEKQRRRIDARRRLDEAQSLIASKGQVLKDLDAAQAALDRAQTIFNETANPLWCKLERIREAEASISRLHDELRDLASDDLWAQAEALYHKTAALSTELAQVKEKARFLRSQYEQPEAWSYNPARVESIRAEAPAKLKEAAALEDRAAKLEQELKSAEKEAAKIETEMLKL